MLDLLWQGTFFGIVSAAVLVLSAVGFTLQFGVSNIMNLSFGALMTLAAFLAYTMSSLLKINFVIGDLAAVVIVGLVSVALNRGIFQPFVRRGSTLFSILMTTFALGIIVEYLVMAIWGAQYFSLSTPNTTPFHFIGWTISPTEIVILVIAAVLMVGVHLLLTYTDMGKAMRAMSDNASLAQLCGVNTHRIADLTWFISGALCGLGGVVLAIDLATFDQGTGTAYLMTLLAAALLGGIGRPYGAMFGALVIGVVSSWFAVFAGSQYSFAVALIALIVVLLFRPQGILSGKGAR